jgi:hypothetical protein
MSQVTREVLDRIQKLVESEFPDKRISMVIAVSVPHNNELSELGIMMRGSLAFKGEVLQNLIKELGGDVIKIPVKDIFPPTPKKDVN